MSDNPKKHKKTEDKACSDTQPETVSPEEFVSQEADVAQTEPTPEEKISQLDEALAAANDKYLRLQAEFQNYRKRAAKEISAARAFGAEDAITPFLQVFDHFNMAVQAATTSDNMDAIRQGLQMILDEYDKALKELGVVRFDAAGADFDPEIHEAMAHEPSDSIAEGKVVKQWNCGYRLGERLIRPATVVVSSGPARSETDGE